MSEGRLLSVREVAERLDVKPRTIHDWIDAGYFPGAFKLNPHASNSHYRIPEADIEAFERDRFTDNK